MAHLQATDPSQPFFSTREQRLALARERFFGQGERPSGLVSEAIIQSWYRCVTSGQRMQDRLTVQTASKLRVSSALRFSLQLREASARGLDRLEAAIASTPCQVILTNPEGMVIYASRRAQAQGELLMRDIARIGVDLSEHALGTNAPGIVIKTGQGCAVHGGEHLNDAIRAVHCAAAPVRDIQGRLAGVLNISIEGRNFGFDALALIGFHASLIEHALVVSQSRNMLLLAFQADPGLLNTPQAALAVIGEDARVVWLNDMAVRLTAGAVGESAEEVLGCPMRSVLSLVHERQPRCVCLPNGLHVWMHAPLRTHDGTEVGSSASPNLSAASPMQLAGDGADATKGTHRIAEAAPMQRPALETLATLEEHQAEQIARAMRECGGKVARAARALGVSRGVIYRHLKRTESGE